MASECVPVIRWYTRTGAVIAMTKIEENKLQKRAALLESAFELFVDRGIVRTSIADITKKAGLAKGTFYLYFSDKYDIRDKLIAYRAAELFRKAARALAKQPQSSFEDEMIFLIDHIIRQLDKEKMLLNFVSKNLEWGIFKHAIVQGTDEIGVDVPQFYQDMLERSGRTFRNPELMLFMIVELVGSTIHNVILYKEPVALDVLKPELYETIRLMIHAQEEAG